MVHGLIDKRRRSPGLGLLNSPFVSLVRLGAIAPLLNKRLLVLWFSCPGLICPVLLRVPNV